MEEGTPEFRSRGEEKGAKRKISKGKYAAEKEKRHSRCFRRSKVRPTRPCSFDDSYRVRVEVSGVAVDGELVVLRDDGVGDLSVGPRSVLGVPVDGAHLSHARSCKKKKRRRG